MSAKTTPAKTAKKAAKKSTRKASKKAGKKTAKQATQKTAKKAASKKSAKKSTKLKSAAALHQQALLNLQDRLNNGERLSDADWERLDKANQTAPDTNDLQQQLAAHYWENRAAAANELNVSVQTISNWCDEFGIDCNRKPICTADLYRNLYRREKEKNASKGDNRDDELYKLQIEEKRAKVNARTGALILEANDNALKAFTRLISEFDDEWTNNVAAEITDEETQSGAKEQIDRQRCSYRVLRRKLDQFAERINKKREQIATEQQSIQLNQLNNTEETNHG